MDHCQDQLRHLPCLPLTGDSGEKTEVEEVSCDESVLLSPKAVFVTSTHRTWEMDAKELSRWKCPLRPPRVSQGRGRDSGLGGHLDRLSSLYMALRKCLGDALSNRTQLTESFKWD